MASSFLPRSHLGTPPELENLQWLDESAHASEDVLKRLNTQEPGKTRWASLGIAGHSWGGFKGPWGSPW